MAAPMLRPLLAATLLLLAAPTLVPAADAHWVRMAGCTPNDPVWVDEDPLDNQLLSADPGAVVVIAAACEVVDCDLTVDVLTYKVFACQPHE